MKCEDVRPLLPEFAEAAPRTGPAWAHIAGCSRCTGELRRYRSVLFGMTAMREELEEPSEGFLAAVISDIPEFDRRSLLSRVAGDERIRQVALPIGGAVVGAAAIGLLWRRAVRKALQPAG